MTLDEIREKKYNLEGDSNCRAWGFYLQFYDEELGLSDDSLIKQGYRLIHPINGLPDCYWGGDVIINVKRMPAKLKEKLREKFQEIEMPERYSFQNISLLPCQGYFQIIKNRCGNDYRIDIFLKLISDYYSSKNIDPLLCKAKMWKDDENGKRKKEYTEEKIINTLNHLGGSGSADEKIKNFVKTIYGIENDEFLKKILNTPEDAKDSDYVIDVIKMFWELRTDAIESSSKVL